MDAVEVIVVDDSGDDEAPIVVDDPIAVECPESKAVNKNQGPSTSSTSLSKSISNPRPAHPPKKSEKIAKIKKLLNATNMNKKTRILTENHVLATLSSDGTVIKLCRTISGIRNNSNVQKKIEPKKMVADPLLIKKKFKSSSKENKSLKEHKHKHKHKHKHNHNHHKHDKKIKKSEGKVDQENNNNNVSKISIGEAESSKKSTGKNDDKEATGNVKDVKTSKADVKHNNKPNEGKLKDKQVVLKKAAVKNTADTRNASPVRKEHSKAGPRKVPKLLIPKLDVSKLKSLKSLKSPKKHESVHKKIMKTPVIKIARLVTKPKAVEAKENKNRKVANSSSKTDKKEDSKKRPRSQSQSSRMEPVVIVKRLRNK